MTDTPSSTPNLDDLRERVEKLGILLADPQPGVFTWLSAYDKAARSVQEFWGLTPPAPALPFAVKKPTAGAKKTDPNGMTLVCPFCGEDPLTATMRFSPIPAPPEKPLLFLVMHGCANVKCARVITSQLVPADWVMMEIPGVGRFRV